MEQNDSSSGLGSRGAVCILKGSGQDAFHILSFFWKLEQEQLVN